MHFAVHKTSAHDTVYFTIEDCEDLEFVIDHYLDYYEGSMSYDDDVLRRLRYLMEQFQIMREQIAERRYLAGVRR